MRLARTNRRSTNPRQDRKVSGHRMKLTGQRIEAYLRQPDRSRRIVLLYGPDRGLVSERADALVAALVADPKDPFAVAEISGAAVIKAPGSLGDEARAIAFGGGERVVRVREAGDGLGKALEALIADPPSAGWVIVEAGELSSRSALRLAAEKADSVAVMACYGDEGRNLESVIESGLRTHGLRVAPEALAYLIQHLGADRLSTRSELDKLALYIGATGGTVELADARACVGDGAPASVDRLIEAVGLGDYTMLEQALSRVYLEGASPIALLRTVANHFRRLHVAADLMARGQNAEQAMKALRPPVIFTMAQVFRRQLERWTEARLATAMALLVDAELECKSTGLPAEALCARALMRIAAAARR